ncbi:HNH endonuclease [Rhizoctonia solani AG-3 Rhs1AP]|uniref:HNH endonuclease n=2 Tax=Rhizoctonia solani AG-3 TaxID=1086053 RepID=A0A074RPD7_9AGAM|nr:HNH endonuclease [Rhizoctonia solani AG-3 Rhs1AP]KEP48719.1 HNH endonuclease [Rhizoctonia solani 123E]
MPTPLPPLGNLFEGAQPARTAYLRILPLQDQSPILIRVLGWMLIYAPNEAGRSDVARTINQCQNDADIVEAGKRYLQYFVKYFRGTSNKPTPTPSNHPSRPSMDALRDEILNTIDQAPTSHTDAKNRALVRDNYRCQLTGTIDGRSFMDSPQLQAELDANPGLPVSATQCTHILPQYIGHHIQAQEARRVNSATIWSIVQAFGGIPQGEVNGEGINHLRNIMTLRNDVHFAFDQLWIWLEPVEDEADTYNVGRCRDGFLSNIPATVTFTSDTELPLPDRRYLALHAACAKVVNMSGAAEYINSILRDLEKIDVLSQDGSSAHVLDCLLLGESLAVS